jgi:hypothetical protein
MDKLYASCPECGHPREVDLVAENYPNGIPELHYEARCQNPFCEKLLCSVRKELV